MKRIILSLTAGVLLLVPATAQQKIWTLQDCLDYALENNIQLRQSRNTYLSGLEDTAEARAALFPTLSASASQNIGLNPFTDNDKTAYSGSYGINSELTLFSGGRLRNNIRLQEVQNTRDSLSVEASAMDIRIAIVQAYMQCLYAAEAVTVNESTVEASQAQRDRAEQMWKAGSISKVDFAQLESQLSGDQYQLTASRVTLDNYRLQLKQLLELGIDEEMTLAGAGADDDEVLRLLPDKHEVYANALETMPEIASSQLAVDAAKLSEKVAKAGYLPTVGLSAGIGTSNRYGAGNTFTSQIQDNLGVNAGLTVSIPIFTGRKNKTAVNKARIALVNSRLDSISVEKSVLKEVETVYLDAVSAQSQYVAAQEKEKYARQSYELTDEQFRLGMKNTVELITAKNDLLSAQQSRLQAKYMALLNRQILDIYQGTQS
ncbi:MAG: TolC family protein [Bacteroidales bacterium]|nr:TolC family protein [Bacteroidales bacterium]